MSYLSANGKRLLINNTSSLSVPTPLTYKLTAYWKFDETGTACYSSYPTGDSSITLSKYGNPSIGLTGVINNCVYCASANAMRNATKSSLVIPLNTNEFSSAMWVKFMQDACTMVSSQWAQLIYGPSGFGTVISFGMAASSVAARWNRLYVIAQDTAENDAYRFGATELYVDQWYHAAVTIKDGSINIYLNGVKDNGQRTGNFTTNFIKEGSSSIYYGTSVNGAFAGYIDEAGMWNRELTPAEVSTLYNKGNGLTYPFQ